MHFFEKENFDIYINRKKVLNHSTLMYDAVHHMLEKYFLILILYVVLATNHESTAGQASDRVMKPKKLLSSVGLWYQDISIHHTSKLIWFKLLSPPSGNWQFYICRKFPNVSPTLLYCLKAGLDRINGVFSKRDFLIS